MSTFTVGDKTDRTLNSSLTVFPSGRALTLMYAQEMGRMALEPQGAALMVPSELLLLTDCMGTTG